MKRKPFALIFIISVNLTFFHAGCSGDSSSEDDYTSKLASIDIADATNLFLTSAGKSSKISGTEKLYKITADGYVKEVEFYDDEGNKVTTQICPADIQNIDSTYVLVYFLGDGKYLVRKTDGAVFSIVEDECRFIEYNYGNFDNAIKVPVDGAGNIYYQTYASFGGPGAKLVRINVADPENLTALDYLPTSDNIKTFVVRSDGSVLYSYLESGVSYYRIKKTNGGLYNMPNNISCFWIGLDGNFKYQTTANTDINTINIDSSYNVTTSSISGVNAGYLFGQYLVRFATRTLIIDVSGTSGIKEVENPANAPRTVTISQISDIKHVDQSDSYYYLSGNNSGNNPLLLRVNPADDSVTTLLAAGDYDVYAMSVSDNDIVNFNALRMADGAKIIGQIDASGSVKILDASLNTEVTSLIRIK